MEKILCGVDIGGTKLSVALVTYEGRVIDKYVECDHTSKSETGLTDQIKLNITKLLKQNMLNESDLEGIGIGCAGHIRYCDGTIITTSNLKGYKGYPLRDVVQSGFTVPVFLDNDANAQAYGEFRFGAGRGTENMVFVTFSTGIGAGIIINGRLYRGMTGTAGEFGHTIVEPGSDLKCTCGNNGCLMAVASGLALPHVFRKKIMNGAKTNLDLSPHFEYSQVDGKLISEGLACDDPLSMSIVAEMARYAGIGLYNIFQALNPELIVIGGGLLGWGNFYVGKVRETFVALARDMIFDPVEIKVTEIGPDAGVIGAASLAVSHA